jgi:NAD(P)-dependent dehydrogenase (short-subunit alcohol dehydrogenase family)
MRNCLSVVGLLLQPCLPCIVYKVYYVNHYAVMPKQIKKNALQLVRLDNDLPLPKKEMLPLKGQDGGPLKRYRLKGKIAIITGGDSSIGKAIAVHFAQEGADIVLVCLHITEAGKTAAAVEALGQRALLIATDIGIEGNCNKVVEEVIKKWKRIDIIVNNAEVAYPLLPGQGASGLSLNYAFQVNIFAQYYFVKYALPYLSKGSAIINTTPEQINSNPEIVYYASPDSTIAAYTYSMSKILTAKGINISAVAPVIVSTNSTSQEATRANTANREDALASCYLRLACGEDPGLAGKTIHPELFSHT